MMNDKEFKKALEEVHTDPKLKKEIRRFIKASMKVYDLKDLK